MHIPAQFISMMSINSILKLSIFFGLLVAISGWAGFLCKSNISPCKVRRDRRAHTITLTRQFRLWNSGEESPLLETDESTLFDSPDEQPGNFSYSDRVNNLIDQLVTIDLKQGLDENFDTTLLTENSDALCKHDLYDTIMTKKMETSPSNKVSESLRKVHSLLHGFVSSERTVRSRLKVTYILAGAADNNMEYCIQMLSSSDEIDDHLFLFINKLIRQEKERLEELHKREKSDETKQRIESKEEMIRTLQMMHRRLKAELKWREHKEMRLLTFLLNESKEEERVMAMTVAFQSLEFLESFHEFVQEGIDFIRKNGAVGFEGPHAEDEKVELAPGTLERMQDVLEDVEAFRNRALGLGDRTNEVIFAEESVAQSGDQDKKPRPRL